MKNHYGKNSKKFIYKQLLMFVSKQFSLRHVLKKSQIICGWKLLKIYVQ